MKDTTRIPWVGQENYPSNLLLARVCTVQQALLFAVLSSWSMHLVKPIDMCRILSLFVKTYYFNVSLHIRNNIDYLSVVEGRGVVSCGCSPICKHVGFGVCYALNTL